MTQGSPAKRIMEFAIPMLLGNFAQQLYNTADSIIVGKFVGDNALAAVGSAMPILNLLCCWLCLWVYPPAPVLWYPRASVQETGRV